MRYPITIILLVCNSWLFSQKGLNQQLLKLEQAIFIATNDTLKNKLYCEKVNSYIQYKELSVQALNEVKRVRLPLFADSCEKANYLWNASILGYLNNDFNFADHVFFEYSRLSKDSSITSHILAMLIYHEKDSALFDNSLTLGTQQDSSLNCLNCLQNLGKQEKYNEAKMLRYSKIIPGLGTIKSGDTKSGLYSMLVHAGTITGSVFLAKYGLYFNATSWSVSLLPRFYAGNKVLTRNTVRLANHQTTSLYAKKCKQSTTELLAKYPIEFRL